MRKALLTTACASLLLPAMATADTNAEQGWDAEVGLNYTMKRGNTDSDALSGKAVAERDGLNWRHLAKLEGSNEEKRNKNNVEERIAERYFGSYKLDRKIDEANYIFNQLSAQKDLFSGYNYETTYALGYGRRIFDSAKQRLDIEAGPGYRVRELEELPPEWVGTSKSRTEKDAVALVALRYRLQITETAQFREEITSELEDGSSVTRAETSLTTAINSRLSLRLSHILRHNSQPADDKRKSDQEILVGLVWSL